MKGPFEEGDIAENFEVAASCGIPLKPAPALSQQDEREIRPLGLFVDPLRQIRQICVSYRFLSNHRKTRSRAQLTHELLEILTGNRRYRGLS